MSDKETPDSAVSGGVTRREALVKAGVVAAGAVAAGSMAGTAKAAVRKKETFSTSKVKYGGRIIWALELIKGDACDVFVVYPSEAGGLTRARQIAALADAAGKWCAIGSWAELGPATMANAHLVASSSNFPFASDTHYPLQEFDVLTEPVEMSNGFIEVSDAPGLGVDVDRDAVERLANIQVRESVFYDDIQGEAPRVGQIL